MNVGNWGGGELRVEEQEGLALTTPHYKIPQSTCGEMMHRLQVDANVSYT